MATIKSFTSLEQSKVLAKILPLESADMYYKAGNETQPTLSELITKESLKASYYLRGEYDTYRQGLIDMYNKIKSDRL